MGALFAKVQLANGDRLFLVHGFHQYWRWKSRSLGGRLNRRSTTLDHVLRDASSRPFDLNEANRGTFLRNHASDIAAIDLFVVPTIGFDLLHVLVVVRLAGRDLVWIMLAMVRITAAAEGASSVNLIELKPAEPHHAVGRGHAHLA
jgi:hypothetical protein